jgi:succinate dehydrogenase / fumarate reductase cytochrome b subunit
MNMLTQFYRSSLGKKYVMAITGLLLFLFVVGHLVGNLQIFLGSPKPINDYAAFLKSRPALLWTARLGLLLLTTLHIVSALQLARENRAARPVAYREKKPLSASFASRTLVASGLVIFAFVVYHLLHFTIGAVDPVLLQLRDSLGRHDVYSMMVIGFSNVWVSLFYIIAMGLLCLHLSHGVGSIFQSLGLKNKTYGPLIDRGSKLAALAIFLGNSAIPIAVLLGWID